MEMGIEKLSWAISLWKKTPSHSEYGKHQLNRAVLYSDTILRKAIEDEIEAEKVAKEQNWTLPECKIMSSVISAMKYPYTDEDGWAFRGKICASSYGKGQAVSLKVKDVCNCYCTPMFGVSQAMQIKKDSLVSW